MATATVDATQFKRVMGSFAASVTVLTSRRRDGHPVGMTATAFTSVSLDPPLCLVCVARASSCLEVFGEAGVLAVNMLRTDQEGLSQRFAVGDVDRRFDGIDHRRGRATDAPLLRGVMASLEGRVIERWPAGDHDVLLVEVLAAEVNDDATPLVYHRGRYAALREP
ncbi:MAG: flavin reductase family protein [Myxococcota bacterium]